MGLFKAVIKIGLIACVLFGGRAALAGPQRCSPGNQDSTCVGQIATVWQTAPTCPAAPGWTTAVPAKWIGSQYSLPQCNYQAAPACPSGYDQVSPPLWTGLGWTGPGCRPSAPLVTPTDELNACIAAFVSHGGRAGAGYVYSGPSTGNGLDQYNVAMAPLWAGVGSGMFNLDYDNVYGTRPTSGINDMFTASNGAMGGFCWLAPGTTDVMAVEMWGVTNTNGGVN
jgi:hypothetical protein